MANNRRLGPTGTKAQNRRRLAERRGRRAEWLAALALMLKGYRILARRYKSPTGEIDLIAVRGRRLAFVEVKQRNTGDDAQWAISARQAERVGRSAEAWLHVNPRYRTCTIGIDAVYVVPGCWPTHHPNACQR